MNRSRSRDLALKISNNLKIIFYKSCSPFHKVDTSTERKVNDNKTLFKNVDRRISLIVKNARKKIKIFINYIKRKIAHISGGIIHQLRKSESTPCKDS